MRILSAIGRRIEAGDLRLRWISRAIVACSAFATGTHAVAAEIQVSSFIVRRGTFVGTTQQFTAPLDGSELKLYSDRRARLLVDFTFLMGAPTSDLQVVGRFNQIASRNVFVLQALNRSGSWVEVGRTSGLGYRDLKFALPSSLVVDGRVNLRLAGAQRVDDCMVDHLALSSGTQVVVTEPDRVPASEPSVEPTPTVDPAPISEPVVEPAPAPIYYSGEAIRLFEAHSNLTPNPERGFHHWMTLSSSQSSFDSVRSQGDTLGIFVVRLDEFRNSSLSSTFLTAFERQLGYARNAGIKLTLKFSYNEGPYPNSAPDATEARILEHIAQLKPVLARNADVIAFVQAGFIGAWGEWHTSVNQLLDFNRNPNAARNILMAVLDALPVGRFVQLRYPGHKVHFFGDQNISSTEAFGSSAKARVGHHNDCFLSNSTDHGTYSPMNYSTNEVDKWKNYIAGDGKFSPVGGETCAASTFSTCQNAITEMARQRYTYLNLAYHPTVINEWKTMGCFNEIKRRLGYRLELKEVKHSQSVPVGGSLSLQVRLNNSGFASVMNPRPVHLVLESANGTRTNIELKGVDPRRWASGESTFTSTVTLPANLAAGKYRMSLWLPDASPSLRDNAMFAIQFANVGVWDSSRGLNVITSEFEVK